MWLELISNYLTHLQSLISWYVYGTEWTSWETAMSYCCIDTRTSPAALAQVSMVSQSSISMSPPQIHITEGNPTAGPWVEPPSLGNLQHTVGCSTTRHWKLFLAWTPSKSSDFQGNNLIPDCNIFNQSSINKDFCLLLAVMTLLGLLTAKQSMVQN